MNARTLAEALALSLTPPQTKGPDCEHATAVEQSRDDHYGFQIRTPDGKYFWIDVEEV